jgi:hypothetical protein
MNRESLPTSEPLGPAAGALRPLPVTFRAVLLGLLLIPANAWWLTQIEYVRYSDNATTSALFFNCVALLLLLLLANAGLRRVRPRWAFTRAELLVVYILVAIGSNLAGHDQLQILFTTLIWVFRYATPENHWAERIHPLLPRRLMVSQEEVLHGLFSGHSTLYTREHLQAWLGPLAWWSGFALVVAGVMLCLAALLRRQWDYERLNYPIAEIPLQVTDPKVGLFRQPAFWFAFGLSLSLQLLNLLHTLYPTIPGVPINVRYYSTSVMPWAAAGWIPISSFPFAYGLMFLLPLQLGFSCWFFFLFSRLELVVAALFGHTTWNRFPYIQQQGVGAYFGMCAFVLWAARGHLRQVWREVWGRAPVHPSARAEPMPYRLAVGGLGVGMGLLVAFAVLAGMRLSTALWYYLLLFCIVLTVARIRAELGLPTIELYQVGADHILQQVSGTLAWSPRDLTVMTLFFWLTRTHRQFPMQTQVDSFRIGHRCPMRLPALTLAMLGATAFGIVWAFWAYLHVMYQVGFESARFRGPANWAFGNEPWAKLSQWLTVPQEPDTGAVGAYVFGFLFSLFLVAMRTRFLWWPFHPVGYLVSGSFGLMRLWLPLFVSWLIKALLLRYGGLKAYRRALPFFIGLVLGEFSAGFLRTLLDLAWNLYLPPESGIGGL